LLGPYQTAFLYVAPRWQEATPLEFNWIVRRESEDYSRLVDYREEFQAGARRFDAGERSNHVTLPIAAVALRQILEWGVHNIAQSIEPLVQSVAEIAESLGLECTARTQRAAHMIGIRGASFTSFDKRLAAHGVYVSVRDDAIRVAPHLYNHPDDLTRFATALRLELKR
jgi:selenocysteine lyase/cysteine desulfurase